MFVYFFPKNVKGVLKDSGGEFNILKGFSDTWKSPTSLPYGNNSGLAVNAGNETLIDIIHKHNILHA